MKALAGAFSALVLLALIALAAAYIYLAPRALPPPEVALVGPIEHILIEKAARKMTVFRGGVALKSYAIALGSNPVGAKAVQGDGRTPEGHFRIDRLNKNSAYHLSLGLDYPHKKHSLAAAVLGQSAGGDIMIHGQPNGIPNGAVMRGDWTAGCIAVTNAQMDEIFAAAAVGITVELRP